MIELKFIVKLDLGLCRLDDIESEIEEWHKGSSVLEIFDYLGITEKEYIHWFETGNLILAR